MRLRLMLGIGATLPAAGKVSAQINAEYRVPAAFLFNRAKFFELPPDTPVWPWRSHHTRSGCRAENPARPAAWPSPDPGPGRRRNLPHPFYQGLGERAHSHHPVRGARTWRAGHR